MVLELANVTRSYRRSNVETPVLRGVQLHLRAGETVALMGPSGCGKTTLLSIAGLLDVPDAGQVRVAGADMTRATEAERTAARARNIGFVYQFHHLLPEFTALENVMMPQRLLGVPLPQAKARAIELLERLKLGARTAHLPAQLSGGEQQRVAIARALANKPALLLADEPTGNLDPDTADDVFAYFLALAKEQGVATLVATHNPQLAMQMGRTVRLHEGHVA